MRISSFLTRQLDLPVPQETLDVLDRLAGQKIQLADFYPDLEAAVHWRQSWMPIYFLPVAEDGTYWYGFHLTPENRAAQRLPIVQATWYPFIERAKMAEVAPALIPFIQKTAGSLPRLRRLFRPDLPDFCTPGKFSLKKLGSSPLDYAQKLRGIEDDEPAARQALAEEACRRFPDWFGLHAARAKIYRDSDDQAAARAVSAAVACYHHTSLRDPQELYDLGRELLGRSPDAFTPAVAEALAERSDVDRFKWIVSFVPRGEIGRTVKLLDDLCFDWHQYETPYVLDFFKHLFGLLDWQWACALCDLRYPVEGKARHSFSAEQAEVWNRLVEQYVAKG